MSSKVLVPVEEYLRTSFDGPDREYVDGEIVERNLGSTPHSNSQISLIAFFLGLRTRHSTYPLSDLRVKISGSRYRVPDIAVYLGGVPKENIPSTPPFLVVEIVSEDDRHTEIRKKLAEFNDWGVKHIWLADPWTRTFSVYDGSGLHEVPTFELPEFGATLSPGEIFSASPNPF